MASLLQHLKERKLVQWAVAYLAGAWVLFEVSDAVGGRLGWPDVLYQGFLIVLAVGFFVTLVLAWYHGEQGRQRVSGPELLMVAALLAIAGVAISTLGPQGETAEPAPTAASPSFEGDRPAIAVLPFENFSPDPEDAYFADGMQEQITARLSGIRGIRVTSRSSVMQYRAERPPSPQIAEELGVGFIVEGSARLAGNQVRLTVQLIDAIQDEHLWAEDYDRELSAEILFDVQGDVAGQVAFAVGAAVTPEDRDKVSRVLTNNTEAYLLYMQGNEVFLGERQRGAMSTSFESTEFYERAIELDPNFAVAHSGLALSLLSTVADEGRSERARQAAEQALALLPGLAEARVALGMYFNRQRQPEEAIRQLRTAEAENPNLATAVYQLGNVQRRLGHFDEAIRTFERAALLDPGDPLIPRALSFSHLFAHQYDDALRENARWEALSQSGHGSTSRAWVHLMAGNMEGARRALSEALGTVPVGLYGNIPGYPQTVLRRTLTGDERQIALEAYLADDTVPCGTSFAKCLRKAIHEEEVGSKERARVFWDSLRVVLSENPSQNWDTRAAVVLVYMGLGEKEAALEAAEALVRLNRVGSSGATDGRFWSDPNARVLKARALAHFGEYNAAIDLLEELLPAPSWLTVPLLEIDPIWDPLRGHPRFQALLEEYAADVEH